MAQRHRDALGIQQGACNPSGIARSLVKACDEAYGEGIVTRADPAVRLIVHQLAFLCDVNELDSDPLLYDRLITACEEKANG